MVPVCLLLECNSGDIVLCRVTIGTWNVGGRLPDEDLDIDDWLCNEESADVYILG